MTPATLRERVADAARRRTDAGLGEATTAYRLVHRDGDHLPGLTVDRLGDVAWIVFRDPAHAVPAALDALIDGLRDADVPVNAAVARYDRPANQGDDPTGAEDAANAALAAAGLAPDADHVVASENGLRYRFAFETGLSHGLFFDMRDVRADLAERWQGRKVLNTFAYTCGFGVALAGVNEVCNVDTAKKYLAWGQENYALNGLEAPAGAFVAKDAFAYLEVAVKVGNRFDAIVLDPPTFSRGKKGKARRFRIVDDLDALATLALDALTPEGELFVSTNAEALDSDAFAARVRRAADARGRRILRSWRPAVDHPTPGAYHLKTALIG